MMKVDDNYPPPRESMDRSKVDNSDSADSEVEVVTMPEERGEPEDVWALRRLSLIHQKSLVIAELAWEDVKKAPEQEYLITWELDGGGLKGHLVTDSTTVSLSLWPDTLYHIQVNIYVYTYPMYICITLAKRVQKGEFCGIFSPNLCQFKSSSLP